MRYLKMKKTSLLIVAVVVFLQNFGCRENPSSVQEDLGVIIPLAIGNTWVTKYEEFDTNGVITISRIDTLIITKDTMVGKEKWYAPQSDPYNYWTNRADGFYIEIENPQLIFKYPAKVNDSIEIAPQQFMKVVSTNDTVVFDGKVFVTYKYKSYFPYPGDEHVSITYINIAPNIGIVKEEVIFNHLLTGPFLGWRTELISYALK